MAFKNHTRIILWITYGLLIDISFSRLKAPSDAQLGIVGLEVELGSTRTEGSRYLLVEIVYMLFEFFFALCGGKIEREGCSVLGSLELTRREPAVVLFVHEVPIPSLVSDYAEVLEELERNSFRDYCSSGFRGHVGVIVIVNVSSPFSLELEVISPGMLSSFVSDVVRYEEARGSEIDSSPSLSSSDP